MNDDHNGLDRIAKNIQTLLMKQDDAGGSDAPTPADGLAPAASPHGSDADDFALRLRDALTRNDIVSAGRFQVLGLARLRRKIGDHWPRFQETVRRVAESTLQRYLGSPDIYSRYGDLGYVVIFAELSTTEAEAKATLIAQEIEKVLLGSDVCDEPIRIVSVVLDVDNRVDTEDVNLLDAVAALAEAEVHRLHEQAADDSAAGTEPLADIADRQLCAQQVHDRWKERLTKLRLIYRPIWDVRRSAVLAFRCEPQWMAPTGSALVGYDILGRSPESGALAMMDVQVLSRITEVLQLLDASQRRLLVNCDLHFETLATPKARTALVHLCSGIPNAWRENLIFEIVGAPAGIPHSRLQELVGALKAFCRFVTCRVDPRQSSFANLRNAGLHDIGVEFERGAAPGGRTIETIGEFVRNARGAEFATHIHGADNAGLAAIAVGAGINYISGEAIGSARAQLGNPSRFEFTDLNTRLAEAPA